MKPKFILGLVFILICGRCNAETYTNLTSEKLVNAVISSIWDYSRPFSGAATVTLSDDPPLTVNVSISSQNGDVRLYVDRGETVGLPVPPDLAAKIVAERKREGENRYFILFLKDDPIRYKVFPDRRAYRTNDLLTLIPFMRWTNPVTIQQVPAGEESVSGRPCHKIEWRMTIENETDVFATVWRASDLGDFPMRLKINNAFDITFTQTKFEKLDHSLFEVPAGYRNLDALPPLPAVPSMISPIMVNRTTSTKAPPTKSDVDARILKSQQELAAKGDAYGELHMGLRYRDGDGVEKNLAKAREWLQKAADQGDPDAFAALSKLPRPKRVSQP